MGDLQAAISERVATIARLEAELQTLRAAAALVENKPENKQPDLFSSGNPHEPEGDKPRSVRGRRKVSIGDAVERLFNETGDQHIDNLHAMLGQEGYVLSKQSLDSALRKDNRHRFELRGKRVFGLRAK